MKKTEKVVKNPQVGGPTRGFLPRGGLLTIDLEYMSDNQTYNTGPIKPIQYAL